MSTDPAHSLEDSVHPRDAYAFVPDPFATFGPAQVHAVHWLTASGWIYEARPQDRLVRRIGGTAAPTPRQGPDGRWQPYYFLAAVRPGNTVTIVWAVVEGVYRCTTTSPVVAVLRRS